MRSFSKFLLSRDTLGHAYSLKYGGNDSYNTYVGAILSLGISVLVLIFLF